MQQQDYDFDKYIQFKSKGRHGSQASGLCPFHNDSQASFSVNLTNGLWICHAGCGQGNYDQFLQKLGADHDLSNPKVSPRQIVKDDLDREEGKESWKSVEQYIYVDGSLKPVVRVTRRQSSSGRKKFTQERLVGDTWMFGRRGIEVYPYRYEKWHDSNETIFLVEGEKCVHALNKIGLDATTTISGSGAWKSQYSSCFDGRDVVIIPDLDESGEKYANSILKDIKEIVNTCRVVALPGLGPKEDVYDYLDRIGTKEDFLKVVSSEDKKMVGQLFNNSIEYFEKTFSRAKPRSMNDKAFDCIIGEYVKAIEPETECDPVAILVQGLACFGNIVGKGAYYSVENTRHYPNLFVNIVGDTAKARKGTSFNRAISLFKTVDDRWMNEKVTSGLSSGEGLIAKVRDGDDMSQIENFKHRPHSFEDAPDPGVLDKRLLVKQEEFVATLKILSRQGNILSAIIRDAWDGGSLSVLTKKQLKSTSPHISIIGHITVDELKRSMSSIETANGFGNRFLWFFVQRSKLLPLPPNRRIDTGSFYTQRLKDIVTFAKQVGNVRMSFEAAKKWSSTYHLLSKSISGDYGSMIARAEAQVVRLSLIYALLDMSLEIKVEHLESALAVWEYAENTCRMLFAKQEASQHGLSHKILSYFKENRIEEMRRSDIVRVIFQRNRKSSEVIAELMKLKRMGIMDFERRASKNSRSEIWYLTENSKRNSYFTE